MTDQWTPPPWARAAEFISQMGTSSADDLALDLVYDGFDTLHQMGCLDEQWGSYECTEESDRILMNFASRARHSSSTLLVGILTCAKRAGVPSYQNSYKMIADELKHRMIDESELKGLEP